MIIFPPGRPRRHGCTSRPAGTSVITVRAGWARPPPGGCRPGHPAG